jgi:hypothetical protein
MTLTKCSLKKMPFGRKMVAAASDLLNKNMVENVLWGNSLLDIYGVPTVVWVRYRFRPRHIVLTSDRKSALLFRKIN